MANQTEPLPTTSRGFHIHNPNVNALENGLADTLTLETHPLPPVRQHDVLIAIHAVSLNWRDVKLLTDTYIRPFNAAANDGRVPCSDGAGVVLAVGDGVTRFAVGDHVAATFLPSWINGPLDLEGGRQARGAEKDGMLREYGVFGEDELVKIPAHLSLEEASTLPCAGLTAWNALFGHGGDRGIGRRLREGEAVLTQGTGGVSLFAAQLALAKGADVVATTSSDAKATKIVELVGVPREKILDYGTDKEWGVTAKKLTKDGKGVDIVVEVTGNQDSLKQSYSALRGEGQISIIGTRGAAKVDKADKNVAQSSGAGSILDHVAVTRRIAIGSRDMFEELNAFLETTKIHPIVDPQIFEFEQARDALMYLYQRKQFGNIVIRIKH